MSEINEYAARAEAVDMILQEYPDITIEEINEILGEEDDYYE